MKVIFLDIDGVLNSYTDFIEAGEYSKRDLKHPWNKGSEVISPGKLFLLERLVKETGARLVLSSTWRRHFTIKEMNQLFWSRGWRLPPKTWFGATSSLGGYGARGEEVALWLREVPTDIEQYVILDDQPVFLESQQDNLVLTDELSGFTLTDFEKARAILMRKKDD